MTIVKQSSSSQLKRDQLNFFQPKSFSGFLLAWLVLLSLMLTSCGGGSTNSTSNPASVSVTVSPEATSVDQGDTIQFSASVFENSNQAVTWVTCQRSGCRCIMSKIRGSQAGRCIAET